MRVGGGYKALMYSLKASYSVGFIKMFQAMTSKNSCKTCAYGMGGQKGGMTDEMGNFPEVCKKSFQAQTTDIQTPISEELFQQKSINDFKKMPIGSLEKSGRLNTPLYKSEGDSHYRTISWEEALEKIIDKFKKTQADRSFFYSSGRASNEAGFLLQLFAHVYGSNNINNSSYYCHQASGVGITSSIGVSTATIVLEDLQKADLIFVIGANPASNHPRFLRQLLNCRRRGGDVIVINPVKESGLVKFAVPSDARSMSTGGSPIASEYIQVNIGGDIALFKGIAKAIIEAGKHDLEFMDIHTNNRDEYLADIRQTSWETIVSASGISKEKIQKIAKIYGNSHHAVFSWAVGITHHEHGVENVESIVNLALLRAMVGKDYAGLLPLRGHSNVQGIGSVGAIPHLKDKVIENTEKVLGVKISDADGMDTMSSMKAAYAGKVDLAFLMGGNLYHSNPDTNFAREALNKISFKVFLTTTLNQGHFNGVDKEVIILPVLARDEEKQKTTQESMFSFVRMSDGGITRVDNAHSEFQVISDIALSLLGDTPVDFTKLKEHKNIRELISQIIPGYEKMGEIDETGEEFQISNRTFHKAFFATDDKKANFRICQIPSLPRDEDEFRMMTVRSEGQFNSIVYEDKDIYRGQTSRQIVMMNRDDIKSSGLKENDFVTLESSVGRIENLMVREFDIIKGNVMTYFPESNILVPTTTDPRSLTPGYKSVLVKIKKV